MLGDTVAEERTCAVASIIESSARMISIVTSQGTQFGLGPGMPVPGAASGRGMALMGALTHTISVEQEAGHTSVVMTRNW